MFTQIRDFIHRADIPPRELELLILRMAWRSHGAYEFTRHAATAGTADVPGEVVRLATLATDAQELSDRDRHLFEVVDDLCDRNYVGDATWSSLESEWSAEQTLQLLTVAGLFWAISAVTNSVRVSA